MQPQQFIAYGRHVVAELVDCDPEVLNNKELLEVALRSAADFSGASVLDSCAHSFQPNGVTVLLLLAESHVSLHTYPEDRSAFFDAFTCGTSIFPDSILEEFGRQCRFTRWSSQTIERFPLSEATDQ